MITETLLEVGFFITSSSKVHGTGQVQPATVILRPERKLNERFGPGIRNPSRPGDWTVVGFGIYIKRLFILLFFFQYSRKWLVCDSGNLFSLLKSHVH